METETVERDAKEFTKKILEMARDTDVKPEAFAIAMADSLGITAAMIDRINPQSMDARLASLNQRIREKYVAVSAQYAVVIPDDKPSIIFGPVF